MIHGGVYTVSWYDIKMERLFISGRNNSIYVYLLQKVKISQFCYS